MQWAFSSSHLIWPLNSIWHCFSLSFLKYSLFLLLCYHTLLGSHGLRYTCQFISFDQSYPLYIGCLTYIQPLTWNLHLDFSRISQTYKAQDQILDLPSCPNLLTFQGLCIGEWHLPLHLIPRYSSPYSSALAYWSLFFKWTMLFSSKRRALLSVWNAPLAAVP